MIAKSWSLLLTVAAVCALMWTNGAPAQTGAQPAPQQTPSRVGPSPGIKTPLPYQVQAVAAGSLGVQTLKPENLHGGSLFVSVTDDKGTAVPHLASESFAVETIPPGGANLVSVQDQGDGYYQINLQALPERWEAGEYVFRIRVHHQTTELHQGQALAVLKVCDCTPS